MRPVWTFRAVRTQSGNVLTDWFGTDKKLQARMDRYLGCLQQMPGHWPMPYYRHLGDGIGEIRFDLRNVEHRLYGYFGPGQRDFTVVFAGSGKKEQDKHIKSAKKLKRQYEITVPELENYDV